MAPKQQEFKHESVQDCDSIVAYLKALTDGVQKGEILLQNNKQEIKLHPHGLLLLEVKAKRSEGKTKLTLQISWKDHKEENSHGALKIF